MKTGDDPFSHKLRPCDDLGVVSEGLVMTPLAVS